MSPVLRLRSFQCWSDVESAFLCMYLICPRFGFVGLLPARIVLDGRGGGLCITGTVNSGGASPLQVQNLGHFSDVMASLLKETSPPNYDDHSL